MRRRWGLLAALLAAGAVGGCLVDVDLGRSPDERAIADAAPPDLDAPEPSPPDRDPPEPVPDARPAPDSAPDAAIPDAEPDVPPDPLTACGPCLAALAAECPAPDCALDAALLDRCARICDLIGPDDCADCPAQAEAAARACFEHAPPDACEPLVGPLVLACAAECGADLCFDCAQSVDGGCPRDAPPLCADGLADDFARCFGLCDDAALSAGVRCAAEAGESWSLCVAADAGPCDAGLDRQIDGCRRLATDGCAACRQIAEAGLLLCAALGIDPAACAERAGLVTRACLTTCLGEPEGRCAAAAEASALACRRADGLDCEGLRASVEATCLGDAAPGPQCDGCLALALRALDGCPGDAIACLGELEQRWGACLGLCGRPGPVDGCLACALTADGMLAQCLADGLPLDGCLAERTGAAIPCAAACGDAMPQALPCSLRAAATLDLCLADQPDPRCFDGAFLLGAACRWTRGGID